MFEASNKCIESAIENASPAAKFELPLFPNRRSFHWPDYRRFAAPPEAAGSSAPLTPSVPLSNNDILHNVAGWADRPRSWLTPASRGNSTANHPVRCEHCPEVSSVIKQFCCIQRRAQPLFHINEPMLTTWRFTWVVKLLLWICLFSLHS